MPFIKISQLTTATAVSATNQFEINQNGASRSAEVSVVAAYVRSSATNVLMLPAGSAAAPALFPTGDTNTGIFFPAADTIAFTEGGVEAMRLDASGNLGIGVAPGGVRVNVSVNSTSDAVRITQTGTGNALVVEDSASPDSTPFVIDNAGRLNVGSQNWYSVGTVTPSQQFSGTGQGASLALNAWQAGTNVQSRIYFNRADSNVVGDFSDPVDNGDNLGSIHWTGSDGTAFIEAAQINAAVDGTPGTNDMPGRLVFSTTPAGAASPTERMRIDNQGRVGIGEVPSTSAGLLVNKMGSISSPSGALFRMTVPQTATGTAILVDTIGATTEAAAFTLGTLMHYRARPAATFGAGSAVTNQYGFWADSALTAAANNFGFYSNIAAGVARTITTVARTSNVVTITTSAAHGYAAGQSVTVAATTNTSLNGTFVIASVPTTTTFTYAQTAADLGSTADTGTTQVVGRFNFYANGTAPNLFNGPVEAVDGLTVGGANGATINRSSNVGGFGGAPFVAFNRRRTTAGGSVVQNGDSFAALTFGGFDGVANIIGARIDAAVDGTPGTSDMPGRLVFSTTPDGSATPTERMRIDSSGNVGIGVSSPVNRLQVNGSFGRGAPVTKTADFTLADTENWIICNGTGSITVTFPTASSWTGREVMIKTIAAQTVVSASSNVVPVDGSAAGTAILAATAGKWATLVSDGTNWIIMAAA
jgi:hypothetical protein